MASPIQPAVYQPWNNKPRPQLGGGVQPAPWADPMPQNPYGSPRTAAPHQGLLEPEGDSMLPYGPPIAEVPEQGLLEPTMWQDIAMDGMGSLTGGTSKMQDQLDATNALLGGGIFDNFLGGGIGDLFRTGGEYMLGQKNIDDLQNLGREKQEQFGLLADKAQTGTEFKPYTVTSGLANVGTTAEGGYGINLSPEQEALQQQLMGQAAGLFGQVGQDPAAQQAAIYEQIRATQRPEEERNRLATEERMLSQGRLGIQSNAYGGASPELLAQETARQEAMGRATLAARGQALAEQQQALLGGQGLLEAGYSPQEQALAMLQGSAVPAGYADVGRRTGTELGSQLQQSGLEGRMQSEDMANQLRLGQQQALLEGLFGQQLSAQDKLRAAELGLGEAFGNESGLFGQVGGWLGSLFGGKG
jgi:hypothetical protein